MNLYFITQSEGAGYDTYDSAVVAAPSVSVARKIHPHFGEIFKDGWEKWTVTDMWCSHPKYVKVKCIGQAKAGIRQGVICASFKAG